MQLKLGTMVRATDGPCGEVADIVIDPGAGRVTHLVVQPHRRHDRARLVPIEQVVPNGADQVELSWSTKQVEAAPVVEETDFIPLDRWPPMKDDWDSGVSRVLSWPYYPYGGLGLATIAYPYGYGWGYGWNGPGQVTMTYDRVPEGTVEVRRASQVLSSDGHVVGHVDGFLVGPDARITHLLLERGHLWGHREVTIPIVDIDHANSDTVHLRVTRDAVGEYPSVAFHRPGHGS